LISAFFVAMDKRNRRQRKRDAERDENGKSIYEKVISGEIEPEGVQKGWKNLKPIPITERSPEERQEIQRKGAEALNKIKGEAKTAKESLDRMLSILVTDGIMNKADIETDLAERLKRENPSMTLYDAVNAVALGRALAGNMKAAEYIRDTRGDAPVKQIEVTENITTEQDRQLLQQINDRLQQAESVQIVESIVTDPEDTTIKE